MCSVPVVDGRGQLGGEPGAWTVTCGRCEDIARRTGIHAHAHQRLGEIQIDKPPGNAVKGPIWLRAYGIRRPCVSCDAAPVRVVGVYPVFPAPEFRLLVLTSTDNAWKLAKHLLDRSRVASDIAATIRLRPHPADHGERFAGGCVGCGAGQFDTNDDPGLREEIERRGLHGLDSIASEECSVVKWHRALYDPSRSLVRV
ncbi:hypothetical protein ACFYO1_08140 [Nocardia sp. NPDC006044]|uniref:hypothetical protein n=1 Tax=Nocardia sp. NPDC006044 TaxID=3364306 RepID=UPI0036AC64D6